MNRENEVGTEGCHALGTTGSPLQSCHVILKQLKQLFARGLRPLPIATGHDEGQAQAGILKARLVRARTRKKRTRIVWAGLCEAVEETATSPEAHATVHTERSREGCVIRIVMHGDEGPYVLVCAGHNDNGSRWFHGEHERI